MTTSSARAFLEGAARTPPVLLSLGPFAVLFGALAVDHGLNTVETVVMSAGMYGGAAQMVALQLLGTHVAPWVIVLSILAVNLRHLLYSATCGRHLSHFGFWRQALAFFFLVDPQFAETERRAEQGRKVTFAWYFGVAAPIYGCWLAGSLAGALFGRLIEHPEALGLDFLLPLYFLGLVMAFRARPRWLPVVVTSGAATILAFHFIGSPWHISIGALAGVAVAAMLPPNVEATGELATAEGNGER
ncbi:AzlC family ABC transporter permease [Pararhizobium mangrovi]|uniref:AzlC family ABC transporter permease n=1 Tax=Pararhizobium mangrovi TaxID=2590452 RepID=A0A506U8Z6_9HYPH|nr:AzlC family ABC transporter permease [Pararhizobium mangrovi]TPW29561.1 AzlC family ABC transporter permease [Pararhizobium mangrovi]